MVTEYEVCQRNKLENTTLVGLLQPLPILPEIWEDISLDFIEGWQHIKEKKFILILVYIMSKYGHFQALTHPYTTFTLAKLFLDQIYRLHGLLMTITSSKDPIFMSNFWKELFELEGVKLCHSSVYHPHIDMGRQR